MKMIILKQMPTLVIIVDIAVSLGADVVKSFEETALFFFYYFFSPAPLINFQCPRTNKNCTNLLLQVLFSCLLCF